MSSYSRRRLRREIVGTIWLISLLLTFIGFLLAGGYHGLFMGEYSQGSYELLVAFMAGYWLDKELNL